MMKYLETILVLAAVLTVQAARTDELGSVTGMGAPAQAENPKDGKSTAPAPTITTAPQQQKITANLLIDTSGTLAKQNVNSSGEGLSFSGTYRFDLGIPLSRVLTASARAAYSEEYSYALPDNTLGDYSDTRLGLSAALGEIRKDLKLTLGSQLFLPTSKDSNRAGLKSAASIFTSFEQTFGKVTIGLTPRYTQFFHDLVVQPDGNINLEKSVALLLEIGYAFTPKFGTTISAQPTHGWTYYGTPRDKYFLNYDVGYEVNKNVVLNLGIYNRSDALKSNGLEYNYTAFDESQFMGYFDVTLSI